METIETDFSTQDLFSDLSKGVFRTFNFPESKWKHIQDVPDIGRTYFQDHKSAAMPFTEASCDRFGILYKSALSDQMTITSKTVTSRLCNVLKKRAIVDFNYLVFYDDDTEKLRTAKAAYWLTLLDKITTAAIGKERLRLQDLFFLCGEHTKIMSRLKPILEGTITFDIIDEPEKEERERKKELTEKIVKEVFTSSTDEDDNDGKTYDYEESREKIDSTIRSLSEDQKGMCLFFLNCSITNVTSFIGGFPKYSQLDIRNVNTCRAYPKETKYQIPDEEKVIPYDDWIEKRRKKQICPLFESNFVCSGYDIEGVEEGIESGISYICIGSPAEYKEIKKYVQNVALFLVVPAKIEQVIYEMESRGYYADAARDRLKSLRDSIDFMLSNDGYVIRWQSGQGSRALSYYAGLIDSVISMNPLTKQLNVGFLQEYRDTIEKMTT